MNNQYSIGTRVWVSATVYPVKSGNTRMLKRHEYKKPFQAVVTGMTYKLEGVVKGGYYGDDPPWFQSHGGKKVYCVRRGMMNKEIHVFPEDLKLLLSCDHGEKFPMKRTDVKWTDEDRKFLSEESKNWERDEKGRWTGNYKEEKMSGRMGF